MCDFTCHRDAVGSINILQKATFGTYVPIDPATQIRVTYLRAVKRWSKGQSRAHRKVERRSKQRPDQPRAWSIARNQATVGSPPPRDCGIGPSSAPGASALGGPVVVAA